MSKLPDGITQAEMDEYARLDAGIKKLAERHSVLNEKIKSVHTEARLKKGTYIYGSVVVKIGETSQVDKETAMDTYPEQSFPQYYPPTFDAKKLPADVKVLFTNKKPTLSVSTSD